MSFAGTGSKRLQTTFYWLVSYLEEIFWVSVEGRGGLLPRRNAMEGALSIISLGVDYMNLISLHFSSFCCGFLCKEAK